MIFSEKSIQNILANKKQQTRRLVKEGEVMDFKENIYTVPTVFSLGSKRDKFLNNTYDMYRIKWQVGKKYAVCSGRGKPQYIIEKGNKETKLYIRIIELRKEKLWDITEEDARKEGFETKAEFLKGFYKINKTKIKSPLKRIYKSIDALFYWNPEVWVITFTKEECEING